MATLVTARRAGSKSALAPLERGPVLLFDGECGVCAASVQWVLTHERDSYLSFAALQSSAGRALKSAATLPDDLDSLVWLEQTDEGMRVHYYSDAVRAVLRYVGGNWVWLARCLELVPRAVRDFGYRLFARYRQSVAAKQCLIPSAAQRRRFYERESEASLGA